MKVADIRGKRVVFVNHCLLNQNTRAPGVAVREEAFTELIQILLSKGLGIEQLPCMESIVMGGVARKSYDRFLPLLSRSIAGGWFPIIKPVIKAWLFNFQRLCKKEAARVVDRIEDYIREEYTVLGVIGVNDSPTCGVTRTMNLIEFIRRMVTAGTLDDVKMRQILQDTLIDGTSYFIGGIMKELKRRELDVKVVGFEPWAESPKDEAERVASLLNLSP